MLSGDGADELFWGYVGRFGSVLQHSKDFRQPHWVRTAHRGIQQVFGGGFGHKNLRQRSIGHWYRSKHTRIPVPWLHRVFPDLPDWPADFDLFNYVGWEPARTAQWLRRNEFVGHLAMVLLKVDRASMYNSVEVRVPFLDREVIDVALRVDWRTCLDVEGGVGKIPLRRALAQHVSRQSPVKRGFTIPMGAWLQGPLRHRFEEAVLARRELAGLAVDRQALAEMFTAHAEGRADYAYGLWVLLSLALWEERYYHASA
jgi:asparagine synthase (glutamine-hydrolysing)